MTEEAQAALDALKRETRTLRSSHSRQRELIREAAAAGASLRAIADVVGVTHETVRTIIRGE